MNTEQSEQTVAASVSVIIRCQALRFISCGHLLTCFGYLACFLPWHAFGSYSNTGQNLCPVPMLSITSLAFPLVVYCITVTCLFTGVIVGGVCLFRWGKKQLNENNLCWGGEGRNELCESKSGNLLKGLQGERSCLTRGLCCCQHGFCLSWTMVRLGKCWECEGRYRKGKMWKCKVPNLGFNRMDNLFYRWKGNVFYTWKVWHFSKNSN